MTGYRIFFAEPWPCHCSKAVFGAHLAPSRGHPSPATTHVLTATSGAQSCVPPWGSLRVDPAECLGWPAHNRVLASRWSFAFGTGMLALSRLSDVSLVPELSQALSQRRSEIKNALQDEPHAERLDVFHAARLHVPLSAVLDDLYAARLDDGHARGSCESYLLMQSVSMPLVQCVSMFSISCPGRPSCGAPRPPSCSTSPRPSCIRIGWPSCGTSQ